MTVWVDASAGASGDMLLGALVGAGVPVEVLQRSVDAIAPEPVKLRVEQVSRNGLAATRCHVEIADSATHRTWRDIEALLWDADLDEPVARLALAIFERLAGAEARAHGHDPADVHFHEVGALDAIADIVGASAGFVHLAAKDVVVSPIAVGSGHVRGAHGTLPVPPPAVAELLRGFPSYAGPPGAPAMELCTPTGAAVLTAVATSWGPQPAMTTTAIGIGAGGRNPEGHANVLRILVAGEGNAARRRHPAAPRDQRRRPRPARLALGDHRAARRRRQRRLAHADPDEEGPAGPHPQRPRDPRPRRRRARDASSGTPPPSACASRPLAKHALDRTMDRVEVDGQPIAVKLAHHRGVLVNAQPEYDDVARAAAALHRPVSDVLAAAIAATRALLEERA